jgi:hypothetical protein
MILHLNEKVFLAPGMLWTARSLLLQHPLVFATLLLIFSGVVCQQVVFSNDAGPSVTIEPSGRSRANLNATVAQALNLCQARGFLGDTRNRLLFSEFLREPLNWQ